MKNVIYIAKDYMYNLPIIDKIAKLNVKIIRKIE